MRFGIVIVVTSPLVVGVSNASSIASPAQLSITIPAQPLAPALKTLTKERGIQIICGAGLVKSVRTKGISGEFTSDEAIASLLRGTKLSYRHLDEKAITIALASNALRHSNGDPHSPSLSDTRAQFHRTVDSSGDQGARKQREFAVVSAYTAPNLEQIVVTAEKRTELLQDVPASVSAISGDTQELLGVQSLSDLADLVPGMSTNDSGSPGYRTVALQGISDGYSADFAGPLVATYIDDVPFSTSSFLGRASSFGLDLNPYDIERTEVLKGPQGTLYGADAMGGLIKYVLKDPDLESFNGRIGAGLDRVEYGDDLDWTVRTTLNIPLIPGQLAARVSGYDTRDAGYIDDVGTNSQNSNHSSEEGLRGTVLWEPTKALSVRLTALGQTVNTANRTGITVNGADLEPEFGWNKIDTAFLQPYSLKARFISLSVNWDLPFGTLTSASGWSRIDHSSNYDLTYGYGAYAPDDPNALALYEIVDHDSKFVQEVRLASPVNRSLEWLVGLYYTRESGGETNTWPTFTTTYVPLPEADNLLIYDQIGRYEEKAGFIDLTYAITKKLDVEAGGRYSEYSLDVFTAQSGVFGAGLPATTTNLPFAGVGTWMVDAKYHVSKGSIVYVRVATAYRPGQGCPTCGEPALGIPGVANPDSLTDYEVGTKGLIFNQRLQYDLSVFYIDWSDIQLEELKGGFGFVGNAAGAKSKGVDLAMQYKPSSNLNVSASLAYTNAFLTSDDLDVGGLAGDQLPVSPFWTGSLSATYAHPLTNESTLLAGVSYRYRDALLSNFAHSTNPPPAPVTPDNIVDLFAGLSVNRVSMRLFVHNVFDDKSFLGVQFIANPAYPQYVPVQPRTVGFDIDYDF